MLDTKIAPQVQTGRRRFEGKTVLITGGAGGMGLAATRMFAEEGARVAVLDLSQEAGDAMAADLSGAGHDVFFQQADLSRPEPTYAGLKAVFDWAGRVDVLFNHAGTIIVKPFHETTDQDYDRLMDINVRSAFMVTREVVKHMVAHGGGSIVITASIGAGKAFTYESLYCISKVAVLMLSNAIAVEYRDQGIRCNAVCPGFVKTAHGLREIDELDGLGQHWEAGDLAATQGRICEPEEVAAAALFLASDEASFINGTGLYVDNGWFVKG